MHTDSIPRNLPELLRSGESGDYRLTIRVGGLSRWCVVHVPNGVLIDDPIPVLLLFHGGGGNPSAMRGITAMNKVSDTHGFLAVYPAGTNPGGLRKHLFWNASTTLNQPDDVAFVKQILTSLPDHFCIDTSRVYAAGISNGAQMAFRLAAELSHQVAAIGTVAGQRGPNEFNCLSGQAVPLIHFHGKQDKWNPFEGGPGKTARSRPPQAFEPVSVVLAQWARKNGCCSETVSRVGAHTRKYSYFARDERRPNTVLFEMDEAGHTWPGGRHLTYFETVRNLGKVNRDLSASTEIWEFVSKFRLEGRAMTKPGVVTPDPPALDTTQNRMQPSFLIAGCQKCGTTALFHYLSDHPQVVPPLEKEINFFIGDSRYHRGLDFYHSYFPEDTSDNGNGLKKVTFEASPNYMLGPEVPRRLFQYNPDLKLVVLVRDPIKRAHSAWQMYKRFYEKNQNWYFDWMNQCKSGLDRVTYVKRNKFGENFYLDVVQELEARQQDLPMEAPLLRHGFYAKQIASLLEFFPREQIHVIESRQLLDQTRLALQQAVAFLKLEPFVWPEDDLQPVFTGDYKCEIDDQSVELLKSIYDHPNQDLFELLGQDFPWS